MLKWKKPILLLFAVLVLSHCSSGGGNASGANAPSAGPRPPSPIDPLHPPRVALSGIREGDFIVGGPLRFELEVKDFPMEEGWQEARIVLNQAVVKKVTRPSQSIELNEGMNEGLNRLTIFLARSFNESVKAPGASQSFYFFYKKKDVSRAAKNSGPGVLLVAPALSYKSEEGKKIPFDFLLTQNSEGKRYRVYYTLDGATREVGVEGAPYYFYNLTQGTHVLTLELMDARGKPIKAPFARVEAQFQIE